MKYSYALSALALAGSAAAQASLWGQCGGNGWTGPSSCVAGAHCSTLNPYYAQCLSGGGSNPTTTPAKTTTAPVVVKTTTTSSTTTTTPVRQQTTPSMTTPVKTTTTPSASVVKTTTPSVVQTTAAPTTTGGGGGGTAGAPITLSGNPFAGRKQYANSYYSSEVISIAIPSLIAEGKSSLVNAAKAAATVPSFVWFDTISKVPSMSGYLDDIRAKNKAGQNLIGIFVVYDLPDRDCAAYASNGELQIANNGVSLYQHSYIDPMAAILKQYPDVPVALVIEPDSLANMITNLSVSKCANAQAAYEACVEYALKTLNLPNVAMYMDAGHAGWLGWSSNLSGAGSYFPKIYKAAGSPASVRGLVTNVANYNAWSVSPCPSYTSGDQYCDEQQYINGLAPLLKSNGFNAQFIVDQSRSGKQPTGQAAWGDWCNAIGTGFGTRPDTTPTDALLDAYVWVKPGGECDGTSNTSAARYDTHCGLSDALQPAPEAGTWFQAYFEQLLVNANPSFM